MKELKDLGEFGLIDLLTGGLASDETVKKSIGDDCAVVEVGKELLLLSCDAFLEGRHFQWDWMSPEDVGHKAAASALSDIAAMGGTPLYALVSLAVNPQMEVNALRRIYDGLTQLFQSCQCTLIGGDTVSSSGGLMLSVTVIGKAEGGRVLYRSGIRPGDVIMVTGHPGTSALGLHTLLQGHDAPVSLLDAHRRPLPRLQEASLLCSFPEVHAMMDISDGLVQDLQHMAKCSDLTVEVDSAALPLSADQCLYSQQRNISPLDGALYGGEDYELALAVAPEAVESVQTRFNEAFSLPLTVIGHALKGEPLVLVDHKQPEKRGWDHFYER
ncbi:MAG: thiamine-phosphate kinase [Candidatus Hydrogenedens sp.]|nr:thiamine-phosphate kinase [Candidatus Hydrogenedens sp.]